MAQTIGIIQRLQVQRNPLKTGEGANSVYDPSPLLTVDALRLTKQGVIGLTADGGDLIDVHHATHPQSRNNGKGNGISFGFITSYDRIQQRFGDHIAIGCAGENIIIEVTTQGGGAEYQKKCYNRQHERTSTRATSTTG